MHYMDKNMQCVCKRILEQNASLSIRKISMKIIGNGIMYYSI